MIFLWEETLRESLQRIFAKEGFSVDSVDSAEKGLDFLETNGLLSLNTEGAYVGSGGFGWTTSLPQADYDPDHVRTIDMWGFAESQETVAVSAQMFEEFIFPYQKFKKPWR